MHQREKKRKLAGHPQEMISDFGRALIPDMQLKLLARKTRQKKSWQCYVFTLHPAKRLVLQDSKRDPEAPLPWPETAKELRLHGSGLCRQGHRCRSPEQNHKIEAQRETLHRLHALGHRCIVQFVSEERVRPNMGLLEQAFLSELEALGISTGPYNLAEWMGGRKGFHERLRAYSSHRAVHSGSPAVHGSATVSRATWRPCAGTDLTRLQRSRPRFRVVLSTDHPHRLEPFARFPACWQPRAIGKCTGFASPPPPSCPPDACACCIS